MSAYTRRRHTDGGRMYRVRLVRTADGFVSYLGPYNTLGAARGQATTHTGGRSGRTASIEFVPADAWKDVEPWLDTPTPTA